MTAVIRLEHLSETQRRALVIADNKIAANSTWDEDLLCLELEELRAEGFDLDITGFDLDEIDRLLQGSGSEAAGLTDDDQVSKRLFGFHMLLVVARDKSARN